MGYIIMVRFSIIMVMVSIIVNEMVQMIRMVDWMDFGMRIRYFLVIYFLEKVAFLRWVGIFLFLSIKIIIYYYSRSSEFFVIYSKYFQK